MGKKYSHVIWDWNGTLLDDVDLVVAIMNRLLERRKMPRLDPVTYRHVFSFPVKQYYSDIGFDFAVEPFEDLAAEFVQELHSESETFRLFESAESVLGRLADAGVRQYILSASREADLVDSVAKLGIHSFFTRIMGIQDHYAAGKIERGRECLAELELDTSEVLLIGDTLHDVEVAREIGCDCLLVEGGHQSRARLENAGVRIADSLACVPDWVLGISRGDSACEFVKQ